MIDAQGMIETRDMTAIDPSQRRNRRGGFSLMEMILATAILAGSGAALFMLIGQASLFGRRAEEQATALHLAQSLLDESVAVPGAVEDEGSFDQDPRWSYRIERESIAMSEGAVDVEGGASPGRGPTSSLVRVTVDVFPASMASASGDPDQPTCRLVRWVRGTPASQAASL